MRQLLRMSAGVLSGSEQVRSTLDICSRVQLEAEEPGTHSNALKEYLTVLRTPPILPRDLFGWPRGGTGLWFWLCFWLSQCAGQGWNSCWLKVSLSALA